MIYDAHQSECPSDGILAALQAIPFAFHLTGSRYMGHARPGSDWDFLAQDSADVRLGLEALGFTPASTAAARVGLSSAGGFRVAAIYQRVQDGMKVQVQLARDLTVMCRVRDMVRQFIPAHRDFDYAQRKYVWDTLVAILQMQPNGHEELPAPDHGPAAGSA